MQDINLELGNIYTKVNGERGWILGNLPQLVSTPFHSEAFEVKWSKLAKGEKKTQTGTNGVAKSVTILVSGKFKINFPDVGDVNILEKEGDYAFFGPGVSHTWEALEDCFTLTFRWPSIPDDQIKK